MDHATMLVGTSLAQPFLNIGALSLYSHVYS